MHLPTSAPSPEPPRRLRRDAFTRRLVREHAVSVNDLIYPVFVHEGMQRSEAVTPCPAWTPEPGLCCCPWRRLREAGHSGDGAVPGH